MNRWLFWCCVAAAAPAWADASVSKLISDKGSWFVRVDPKAGIVEGTELSVVSDDKGTKEVGKATVMELKGALARVSLDDDAAKAKARFVRLPGKTAAAGAPAPSAPEAAAPAREKPPSGPPLQGRIEPGGMRVSVYNDSGAPWTQCEIHYDDGRFYKLGELAAGSDDGVMLVKFSKPPAPPDPVYDHVVMRCSEGEGRFLFDNPTAHTGLEGFAENAGGGKVVVHNESGTDWTRCEVRKPDKSHYVLGTLKAHDHEQIRSGLFKTEPEPSSAATTVWLACAQGVLSQALK